jgi:hypothetical protein
MLRSDTVSILRGRRYVGYMWELTLDCGHVVFRGVKYNGKRKVSMSRNRPESEVKLAPIWVHCEYCKEESCPAPVTVAATAAP